MSLSIVHSRAVHGLSAPAVRVEVHLANGLPQFSIVGLPETSVRESRERVRAALLHSGFDFPNRRITVNLAPADLPKDSGRFDLPIAIGILAASGQVPCENLDKYEFAGELSLTGALQPIRAAFALACHAAPMTIEPPTVGAWSDRADNGGVAGEVGFAGEVDGASSDSVAGVGIDPLCSDIRRLVLPLSNLAETAGSGHPAVAGADTLADIVSHLRAPGRHPLPRPRLVGTAGAYDGTGDRAGDVPLSPGDSAWPEDMSDVVGQLVGKRALEIAAAGHHALLLFGPPGTGKSMLARRLPGLLPPWSRQQARESASIASLTGQTNVHRMMDRRPFRAPHHSVSPIGLVGGGHPPRPGEISLAHNGTLFLDELPEFRRAALEALREPLESGSVIIARGARSVRFPAAFRLVAAMNPCPCGHAGDTRRPCQCTYDEIRRYRSRISGPMLDRFDLGVEVTREPVSRPAAPAMPTSTSNPVKAETTAVVAARVRRAAERAIARQGVFNAHLPASALDLALDMDEQTIAWAHGAAHRLDWSMRALHRTLKVARTIADLDDRARVGTADVAEAISLRAALDNLAASPARSAARPGA